MIGPQAVPPLAVLGRVDRGPAAMARRVDRRGPSIRVAPVTHHDRVNVLQYEVNVPIAGVPTGPAQSGLLQTVHVRSGVVLSGELSRAAAPNAVGRNVRHLAAAARTGLPPIGGVRNVGGQTGRVRGVRGLPGGLR